MICSGFKPLQRKIAKRVATPGRTVAPGAYAWREATVKYTMAPASRFLGTANATVVELCARGYAERMVLSQDACATIDWFPPEPAEAALCSASAASSAAASHAPPRKTSKNAALGLNAAA